jgi:hypothetical protein
MIQPRIRHWAGIKRYPSAGVPASGNLAQEVSGDPRVAVSKESRPSLKLLQYTQPLSCVAFDLQT